MIASIGRIAPYLDGRTRWWLAAFFVATLAASALETFGVGLVFVFFQAALDPDKLRQLPVVGRFVPAPEIAAQAGFIAAVSLVVFVAFLVRSGFQALVAWLTQDLRRRLHLGLAERMFCGYLRQPYVWHLSRKASELYFNVSSNTGAVAQNVVIGMVELAGAVALLLFFILTLGWLKPFETLVAFVLLGGVITVYLFVFHWRSLRWGEVAVDAGEATVRAVSEPLRGIKTVKVLGIERMFEASFRERMRWYLGMFLRQGLAQVVPKLLMELVLVAALLGTVTAALAYGQTPAEIIPTMALFGAAAYRLVPTAARVAGILQQYRFSLPALDAVVADLQSLHDVGGPQAARVAPVRDFRTIQLAGIGFRYPGAERAALAGIDLQIGKGELIALVGPSGAGKTTLADIVLGLLRPVAGTILLDGRPQEAMPAGLFGYVPQEPFVAEGSLQKNIAFGVEDEVDQAAVLRAVEMAAFADVVARMPDGLGTKVGEGATGLSGGERQRLGLARALYHDPMILVLDEPTSALDSVTEATVSAAIRSLRGRKTVIVIAHRLSTVRDFDRIVYMKDGRVEAVGRFDALYAERADFRDMADRLSTESGTQGNAQ